MAKKNTATAVEEIVKPYADELNLSVWDITFAKEGSDWYLRIFIDKEGGVSIDDCVDLTHAITKPLDDADPIKQSYILEVSSPGVERALTKDKHFESCIGMSVNAHLVRAEDGVRDFNGILKDYKDKQMTIVLNDSSEITLNVKDTAYVKLDDFDDAWDNA